MIRMLVAEDNEGDIELDYHMSRGKWWWTANKELCGPCLSTTLALFNRLYRYGKGNHLELTFISSISVTAAMRAICCDLRMASKAGHMDAAAAAVSPVCTAIDFPSSITAAASGGRPAPGRN